MNWRQIHLGQSARRNLHRLGGGWWGFFLIRRGRGVYCFWFYFN